MNYEITARKIVQAVGGKENIKALTRCFTRLRFVLYEEEKANTEMVKRSEGVISVISAGGEYQVVCGAKVEKIYEAVSKELGMDEGAGSLPKQERVERKGSKGARVLQAISQIFTPLVPAIAAAGLLKGGLTAAKLLMSRRGIDITMSDTYVILYAVSQVIFYFFPIFLAMTTAKVLRCHQVIAMVLGAMLCYPAIDSMIQDVQVASTIFGIPITKGVWKIGDSAKVFSYTESVIPIILAVIVMAYLERFLKRWIPEVVQLILVPGIELLVMVPVTLCILGPIGIYIGNAIAFGYESLIGVSEILAGGVIGALWGVFVIFGAHRALIPIGLNDVAMHGRQNILAFAGAANFAQGGAALGVWLKTRSTELKQVAASGTIAAAVVGVTEPAIYGCNLPYKKPMICAIIAGGAGGAIMGAGHVYGDAFANNGILTIFTYAAFGMSKFLWYLAGVGVAFFGAAILTYVFGLDESEEDAAQSVSIASPMSGTVIPLSEVNDDVFAAETLGKGVAIVPTVGEVVAPEDATVSVVYPTGHAICLTLKNGMEVLFHIGINTVRLDGRHFTKCVQQGDVVTKGTVLLRFDMDGIQKEGYDLTSPIIVLNGGDHVSVEQAKGQVAKLGQLMQIKQEKYDETATISR